MFGLDPGLTLLLIVCILCACAFEFVNGFHDTANAVATVIYTNTLKAKYAVVWSGIWNFIGVFAGGISVAMGIVNLLPVESLIDQDIYHSVAMVLALLLTAIIWNLGTWYYGIPCSSSHTVIGAILGVGLAFSLLPGSEGTAVNWSKAGSVGISLLISPAFGFGAAIILMLALKYLVKDKTLFKEPSKNKKPPLWIRGVLLLTCTGVSFSHGSNDGQKGVGLVMLILIGIVPAYFALDSTKDPRDMRAEVNAAALIVSKIDTGALDYHDRQRAANIASRLHVMETVFRETKSFRELPQNRHFALRKEILIISGETEKLLGEESLSLSAADKADLKEKVASMRTFTDYAPFWVILLISLSLGSGTMIGWKRIVTTIGEKIGKQHLTYAQGASSEVVAAATIGVSTMLGLPVSTTHVLSSGIAGSMVASGGMGNLQGKTIKTIALAWVLTLPVCIIMAGSLFLFFRMIF